MTEQHPYLAMLAEWQSINDQLSALNEREKELRNLLFAGAFPNAKEGTNVHKLPDGREVVGVLKINRKVDEAALPSTLAALREAGVANADALVRFKPELAVKEWRTLSPEMQLMFSPALISTPGMPALEVRTPKRRAR